MRHYEGTIVLDPTLQDDGCNRQMERIKKYIEDRGGKIVEDDRWGLRTLAYEVKKQTQGYYGILEWEGPGELVGDLDHLLRLDEHILRHLIIHLDPKILAAREEIKQRRAARPHLEDGDEDAVLDEDEDEFGDEFEEDDVDVKAGETAEEAEPEHEYAGGPEQDEEGREEE